jgi:hypothetical protein
MPTTLTGWRTSGPGAWLYRRAGLRRSDGDSDHRRLRPWQVSTRISSTNGSRQTRCNTGEPTLEPHWNGWRSGVSPYARKWRNVSHGRGRYQTPPPLNPPQSLVPNLVPSVMQHDWFLWTDSLVPQGVGTRNQRSSQGTVLGFSSPLEQQARALDLPILIRDSRRISRRSGKAGSRRPGIVRANVSGLEEAAQRTAQKDG